MSRCFKCFFLESHNALKTYCKLFRIQNTIFHLKIDWATGGRQGFQVLGWFGLVLFFVNFVKKLWKISLSILAKVTYSFYYLFWLIQHSWGHFHFIFLPNMHEGVLWFFLPWYQSAQHHFKVKYQLIWNHVSCHIKTENSTQPMSIYSV